MTVKGGSREVLGIAWPLIITTASYSVMQFFDRVFLANYSGDALRAVVPASILAFTFICGFRAVVVYANTFVAQYHGAGEPRNCALATMQSLILSFVVWPLILLLIPVGRAFFRLADHPPAVLAGELDYFTIALFGSITNILSLGAASFFIGRGKTFFLMSAVIVGNSLNILLNYLLIFGKFGLPEMGIRGAALGTVLSPIATIAILLTSFFSKKTDREYNTRSSFQIRFDLMKRMIRFAFPSGIHFALHIGSFAFFVVMVGRIGPTELAASNIVLSVNLFAFLPMIGLGLATQTLLGQYMGAGDPRSAERSVLSALKIGFIYIALIGSTFVIMPNQYIALFTGDADQLIAREEVFEMVRILMLMLVFRGLADMVDIVLSNALKGAGDTRFVMVFSLATAWTMLGVCVYLIIEVFNASVYVAWAWAILYLIVMAVGYWLRFKSERWKTIDLLGKRETPPAFNPDIEVLAPAD